MSQIIQNANQSSKTVTVTRNRVSKKEKARELYLKYHELPRSQIIEFFINELGIPESSARTYVSGCAKELNLKLGKEFKTRNVKKSNLKRERAFQIYSENAHLDRKQIIQIMEERLGMSHNSAATHCSLAHKAYQNGYNLS